MLRTVIAIAVVCLLMPVAPALAQTTTPEAAVEAHFKAIRAEDYTTANAMFSESFLRAFNSDGSGLREYYTTRRKQVEPGWKFVEVSGLADEARETALVVVEFNDPRDAPMLVSERMYYYLIREPVKGKALGRAADGKAWRIDIFDALRYPSLAEARRRPYLYTREAWPEDEGRELRSRQGLFRIQWALTSHFKEHGAYPGALAGGDGKHEPLISGGYLPGAYPLSGFSDKPMRHVEFNSASPGDFSYYAIDADGDGTPESYWLLLHGASSERNYFTGYSAIYIASGGGAQDQAQLASEFAGWWQARGGEPLQITVAVHARVASFSLIRPRIEEAPASWWAQVRGRGAGQWVYSGGRKLLPEDAVNRKGLNVLTFGL